MVKNNKLSILLCKAGTAKLLVCYWGGIGIAYLVKVMAEECYWAYFSKGQTYNNPQYDACVSVMVNIEIIMAVWWAFTLGMALFIPNETSGLKKTRFLIFTVSAVGLMYSLLVGWALFIDPIS